MPFPTKRFLLLLCSLSQLLGAQSTSDKRTFDYVVIGGGTAGLVVAARLSEDPKATVAVIEAGIYHVNDTLVDTPEQFGQALGNLSYDWNFATVPQPALNNNIVPQARGKMLGGTSGLNFMFWNRATSAEYDAWETLGATGWNWRSLLPYLKKVESVAPQTEQQLFPGSSLESESTFDRYHGRSGPLQATYNVFYSNITDPYVEALNALGIPTNSDPYSGDGTGVYNCEMTIDLTGDTGNGKRSYSASTYYVDAADRPNFTVFTATQATKINFASNWSKLRATSVDVVSVGNGGVTGTITARKEVILSAGTFQTPQLLELSGIGNRTILQAAGVHALIDLPGVGENLQDHSLLAQDFEIDNNVLTYDELRNNATFLSLSEQEYATNGTGIFASASFVVAFPPVKAITTSHVVTKLTDSAIHLVNSRVSALTKAQYEFQKSWLSSESFAYTEYLLLPSGGKVSAPSPDSTYITILASLQHPWARGNVHINTSQPLAPPLINPRYLGNDVDLQLALESAKFVRKVTKTAPLSSYVISPNEPPASVNTDDDFMDYIKASMRSLWHPVGTAPMLPRNIGGVVDPTSLIVYDTTNLRIVDASVFPLHIAGHPQTTIYAIAERAADMIKGLV